MKKHAFWIFYGVYLAVIIIFIVCAVRYVQKNIDEYEAYQPERVLDNMIDGFEAAASNGTIYTILKYPDIEASVFDPEQATNSIFTEYERKVAEVDKWTYGVLAGSYSASKREYGFYGDGELLAKATITSDNERPILADFLTVNEWKPGDVVPFLTYKKYVCAVEVPKGFYVWVNDIPISADNPKVEATENENNVIYRISDLLVMPSVKAADSKGNNCPLTETDGYFSADVIRYHLILPDSYTVYENGDKVTGVKVATGTEYKFDSVFDSLEIRDSYNQTIRYKNGDNVGVYDVSFRVPSNFEVNFLGEDAKKFLVETEENPLYAQLKDVETRTTGEPLKYDVYSRIPMIDKYTITDSIIQPEVLLCDNTGLWSTAEFENNYFEITTQTGTDEIPKEILEEINPLEIAKLWSLFMSDDVPGNNHGYSKIEAFLLPDTQWYTFAIQWCKGVDITFVSRHSSTEFVDERVTNYVRYSDVLFSCDIFLDKDVYVTTPTFTGDVHDYINSTFYFYRYNGVWKLLTFIDKLA